MIKIAQYFVSWQEELKSFNRSINTVIAYAQDFLDFKNFYEDYHNTELSIDNFKTITPQDIRAWMMHQRKKQKNIRSSARGLAGLKNFSQFLLNLEVINDHAFFHSRSPKLQKTLPRPVTIEQALSITENIADMGICPWVGLRDKALMQLLYCTGMRIGEALGLNQQALQHEQFITVCGKGKKYRQVPVTDSVKKDIFVYLDSQPFKVSADSPLFYGKMGKRLQAAIAQKTLRNFRRSYGMPESLTPHALRHSCASHLMQSSHDLRGIQELLGHVSLSSTQIYTQIDEMALMKTYKGAHPRAKKPNQ